MDGAAELLRFSERNQPTIEARLREDLGFARAMLDFDRKLLARFDLSVDGGDTLVLRNLASFAAMLLPELVHIPGVGKHARESALQLIHALAGAYIQASRNQLPGLRKMCQVVTDAVSQVPRDRRIILIELPTGNTVPVRLLEHMLRELQHTVVVLSASLSRNDSNRAGTTRAALIEEMLNAASPQPGDVVVYTDEWNSGVNFGTLTKFISKVLQRANVRFVPVGLLASTAKTAERYASFVDHHDKLAHRAGINGSDARIEFPALRTRVMDAPPFFWAEHDRLAGYRKMQVLGAMFSSLDAAIERLASEPERRQRAFNIVVELHELGDHDPGSIDWRARRALDIAKRLATRVAVPIIEFVLRHSPEVLLPHVRRHLVGRLPFGVHAVRRMSRDFSIWLASYRGLRSTIEHIVHESNTGAVEDVYEAIEQVGELIAGVVRGTPAERLVALAQRLEEHEGGVDPADRYFFKAHTPILTSLRDDESALHHAVMQHVFRELAVTDAAANR
ncbi:MAG TPA: hypothetical protein VH143_16405 [Kofleriaceae bacterium]|jgi:hypothetical protein|nr:hypothetical protein [Kofleriaceae bacterium]